MSSSAIEEDVIRVVNAREHNLRNLTFDLPKQQLVALAGVSGAGKSTIAHHLIANTARRRLGRLRGEDWALSPAYEPAVDSIEGLPPCIEIVQEPLRGQSRSTVATYTGLNYHLAGLYLHCGASKSVGGFEVHAPSSEDLAKWLLRFHRGKNVLLAKIRPDVAISSKGQLPKGEFYFRERRSRWASSLATPQIPLVPGLWWLAQPSLVLSVKSEADAHRLLNNYSANSLLVIDQKIYFEHGCHRLAEDEPAPFEPFGRSLFSFNISAAGGGQCSACSGLGVIQGVKECDLIGSPSAPILNGGLNLPQSKGKFPHLGVLDDILRGLLHLHKMPLDASWSKLPSNLRKAILYGSGRDLIPELRSDETKPRSAKRPFVGIIPLVMSRAQSTGASARIFKSWVGEADCPECGGSRFNYSARSCIWRGFTWSDIAFKKSIGELCDLFENEMGTASEREADYIKGIITLLNTFRALNLGHLSLNRATSTLSGGEAQRLKLGLGLALELRDTAYVLDEPSRGLHPQDVKGLTGMLRQVVATGNTVILVEHQKDLLAMADHVITLGPAGGTLGGQIIKSGLPVPEARLPESSSALPAKMLRNWVEVSHVNLHNLKNVAFRFPAGRVTAVVGVSGAGKSSAILGAMVPAIASAIEGGSHSPFCQVRMPPGTIAFVDLVGQKLARQNRRSTVATALEMFDGIREHFANQSESKSLGLKSSDFSFNSTGACPECGGSGFAKDGFGQETQSRCHACDGSRLASSALLVESGNFNLAQLLNVPITQLAAEALTLFDVSANQTLSILVGLGLGHLALGRATSSLSTGERQRLALARFLSRIDQQSEKGLLVLDEPTAGLSMKDACSVFERIKTLAYDHGHTVVVLEHKLEMLASADWLLEFGPVGGPGGGKIVFEGIPAELNAQRTATSLALSSLTSKPASASNLRKGKIPKEIRQTDTREISWNACADVFEPLATNLDVRDEVELVRPLHPAVRLNPERMPEDFRVGDLLELSKWIRLKNSAQVPSGVKAFANDADLAAFVGGKDFWFSPLSSQLRLGLAVMADMPVSVRRMEKLGFCEAVITGTAIAIKDLPKRVKSTEQLKQLLVLCPSDASSVQRKLALRLSEGVAYFLSSGRITTLTTQFLGENGSIGLGLHSPYVGDYHSPQGRCMQCLGSGRLRAYPWNLIVADEKRTFKDDTFWHPAILPAIRGLRRSRLLPEATFFATQGVAEFLQPILQMTAHARLLFEYGIPWRRFLKPSATRKDREQDYFSWRGLHDYVHQCLSGITDLKHKAEMRNNILEALCPKCKGTGMGWEAQCLMINGATLNDAWKGMSISKWRDELGCSELAISAAIDLGLEALRPNERWRDLPNHTRHALLIAMSHTAPLDGLSLLSASHSKVSRAISKFLQSHKMQVRYCA